MSSNKQVKLRQLECAQAAMLRGWGHDWTEHPKAAAAYRGLVSHLDEHGTQLRGGSLGAWKKEAISSISRVRADSSNDVGRVTGPGIPWNRKGAAPALPRAPPQTSNEQAARTAVEMQKSAWAEARKKGKARQCLNGFGVQTALPASRRTKSKIVSGVDGAARLQMSGVSANTTPSAAQKSGSSLEALTPMPGYTPTVLANVGGSSGPIQDVGVACYKTGEQPTASHL